MLEIKTAVDKLVQHFSPVSTETISFNESMGRVLAEPIFADQDSPPFSNSSMDGFAVIKTDLHNASPESPVNLAVIEHIPAGSSPLKEVTPGTSAQIMTGAPLPQGADAVIPVEETDHYETNQNITSSVKIYKEVELGENIRLKGENYQKGERLISPGTKIRPQEIALLAMVGKTEIQVYRKPRIGLLITGDELIPPKEPLSPGTIRDTNSYLQTGMLQQHPVEILNPGIIRDSEEKIWQALESLIENGVDLIITTGGVSMGTYDFVRKVIEDRGSLQFWRVNMKPGKPLAFGNIAGIPIIGLPGNPVSSFVGFQVFIRPAIEKLTGAARKQSLIIQAELQEPLQSNPRESYIPAVLQKDQKQYKVIPVSNQSSGNLYSIVQTNSLIILPAGVKFFNKGDLVNVWNLDCHSE